ncbi:MAG: M28 family peptidase, partial [Cyclonatronaceae bacterium]
FYPLMGGAREYDGPVVFAGNGRFGQPDGVSISGPGTLQDSWALVFEPAADSPSRGEMVSTLTREHGALGVIFIPDTDPETWEDKAVVMSRQLERPRMLRLPDGRSRMAGPSRGVAVSIHPGLATELLGLTGPGQLDSLRHLREHEGGGPERFQTGYRFRNRPELATRSFEEDNIIAVIPGSDAQLANEMVVLTAHYDHMGLGEPDYRDDIVYSGADDNASGTAVLMQVARAFEMAAEDGYRPSRTLVFLHLAAEEWGLIGARYFIRNNPFEEYDITTNINVDMVGYVDNVYSGKEYQDYIYVIGAGMVSTRLEELLHEANNATSELLLDDTYNNTSHRLQLYRRSDHWVFAEQDIPFVFFFSGLHDYYHGPSDTADRIDAPLLALRARLITELVWYLAETPERPDSDRKKLGSGRVPSR